MKIGNGAVPGELGRCKQDAINDMVLLLLMMQLKVFIQVRIPGLNTNTVVLITDKGVYLGNNREREVFMYKHRHKYIFCLFFANQEGFEMHVYIKKTCITQTQYFDAVAEMCTKLVHKIQLQYTHRKRKPS